MRFITLFILKDKLCLLKSQDFIVEHILMNSFFTVSHLIDFNDCKICDKLFLSFRLI